MRNGRVRQPSDAPLKKTMWDGKNKALTFSFDDGVTQDKRAIEILNKYGLKSTFNINSSLLGMSGNLERNGKPITHNKNNPSEIKRIYNGHEVAVHTLIHPSLPMLDDDTIIHQVETDRKVLSEICGYEVVGMAYPGGGENNNERVAEVIRKNTGVKYARTITSTNDFEPQNYLYRFNPSVYYIEHEKMFEMATRFLEMETERPQIFYIWGHTYEMDAEYLTWERFEEFCKFVSNKKDIYYGTNRQVFGL